MEVSDGDESGEKAMPPLPQPPQPPQPTQPPPPKTEGAGGSGEKSSKRKMKTAYQLELLEKTYATASYPSEAVRAELSVKLDLSDRQLQMWFCHRRLKDRKASEMAAATPAVGGSVSCSGSSSHQEPRKALARMYASSSSRMIAEPLPPPPPPLSQAIARSRYYDVMPLPHQSVSELNVVAFVESQLGERIREDGPILGMVFDPLPPGAFGAPLDEPTGKQKHTGRSYDAELFEGHDTKSFKASSFLPSTEHCLITSSSSGKRKAKMPHSQSVKRPVHEYQFLPEQPSARSDGYGRVPSSHMYDPLNDDAGNRVSPLQSGRLFIHDNSDRMPIKQGTHHNFPSSSMEYDGYHHKTIYSNSGIDAPFSSQHAIGIENPFLTPDRRMNREEDVAPIERKRKSEEARIAKEVEAHEKRIRKELEKQDILRRKREENMRKEMERHGREKRKEEERLLREKQREEERYQRELKREQERRERFLQKENQRAEKMRLKEEMRREKEAAKIKAANERATARRIAREYMDLIEDERLELMEHATSSKDLPSITSLDSDTLQNLNLFQGMLKEFPPKSVCLKQPFAIQPWANSEENIGNLLMVWRFLITFADVLSLWPFTLDEFVQALHDYDPRLLGEILIALLKCIIKDIEDVARTPATSLGGNHSSAANPSGGHPQVIEGAYAWGFDIRSWQTHLNPLTWPEILRQFALSAGFGPQLKKRVVERSYYRDENEGHDGEDIVSTLRSGMAAENALAVMQEKGFSQSRKPRHRLTPGTVKFAAFHVLSLEGDNSLTILEVADKIQASGLRDLTTSKTPEASIAAALSRDTKLFERTAPSTYCVRPAYRKDPSDAEAILAAAREKIQIFENGFSESEEAEKDTVFVDDAERDEVSESDGADDLEIDGVNPQRNFSEVPNHYEVKSATISSCLGNGNGINFDGMDPHDPTGKPDETKDGIISGAQKVHLVDMTSEEKVKVDDTEIDESNSGEPWVQGLMEGEYSDISVEERLNSLVSLVSVAIEGNTIRVILEERMEAANALKKQMWAEAQLDKRRMKEEYMSRLEFSSAGLKTEITNADMDGSHNLFNGLDNKGSVINLNSSVNGEPFDLENPNSMVAERNMTGQEIPAYPDGFQAQQNGNMAEKSRSQLKAYIGHKAEQVHVYRSLPLGQDRRRNRYWQFTASASKNDPGSGRIFFESRNGFWRVIDSEEVFDCLIASLDTRGIRESHLHTMLQKIESSFKETIRNNFYGDNLSTSQVLKTKSVEMISSPDFDVVIDSPQSTVCGLTFDASEQSSTFKVELGRNDLEKNTALKRYQDFQRWVWNESFNPTVICAKKFGKKRCPEVLKTCNSCFESYFSEEKHCPLCHRTFKICYNFEKTFSDHVSQCEEKLKIDPKSIRQYSNSSLPIRFQILKTLLANIEASIPSEALQPFWTDDYRKCWGMKLHLSSTAEDLFQMLTLLETSINRDYLSSSFETTNELLGCSMSVINDGLVPVLPWIPHTTAAVALRLMDLDASIFYALDQKVESPKEKDSVELIKLPTKGSTANETIDFEANEMETHKEFPPESNWAESVFKSSSTRGRGSRGRGTRGRGRGGRPRGSTSSTKSEFKEERIKSSLRTKRRQPKCKTRGRGRSRGRRTVRPRQIPPRTNKLDGGLIGKNSHQDGFINLSSDQRSVGRGPLESSEEREEWNDMETPQAYAEEEDNTAGYSGSDDNNGLASGDEYDDQTPVDYSLRVYGSAKHRALLDDESEEDIDRETADNVNDDGDRDYNNEDMEDDLEDDDDMIEVDGDETADFDRNGIEDDGNDASYSSEYSD